MSLLPSYTCITVYSACRGQRKQRSIGYSQTCRMSVIHHIVIGTELFPSAMSLMYYEICSMLIIIKSKVRLQVKIKNIVGVSITFLQLWQHTMSQNNLREKFQMFKTAGKLWQTSRNMMLAVYLFFMYTENRVRWQHEARCYLSSRPFSIIIFTPVRNLFLKVPKFPKWQFQLQN